MKIRVLVVENSPHLRRGLVSLLQTEAWTSDVEEAGTAQEAISRARTFLPDVVLVDHSLPTVDGVTTTRLIAQGIPGARVIVFCLMCDDTDEALVKSRSAGAHGYVGQCTDERSLTERIRRVASPVASPGASTVTGSVGSVPVANWPGPVSATRRRYPVPERRLRRGRLLNAAASHTNMPYDHSAFHDWRTTLIAQAR